MRSGFNDDQNSSRFNFLPHTVNADTERGIPAVNKLVSRLDEPGILEICVDDNPDPTLNGGGTWKRIGGWRTFTPVLRSTGTAVNIGSNGSATGQYATVGNVCHVQVFIQFGTIGVAAGTGSYYVELTGLPHRAGSNFGQGNGTLADDSATGQQDVVVTGYPSAGDPCVQLSYTGTPFNLVGATVPWAWSNLDVIEFWMTYRTVSS